MKTVIRFGALGLAAALAACNGDGTSPSTSDPAMDRDIAMVAADASAQDVEMMGGPGGLLGLGLAPAATADDRVPFLCGTHQRDGLTVVRTCTFKDADGNTQAAYDPDLTASATIHATVTGTVTRLRWSADVDRTRDFTVSGLVGQETTRTWNGTGTGTTTRERHADNGTTRQYNVSSTLTVTDVVVPVPRSPNGWPLSGTITRQVTVTVVGGPHDGETRTRTVTITFDGTAQAHVSVGASAFTFDMNTRDLVSH